MKRIKKMRYVPLLGALKICLSAHRPVLAGYLASPADVDVLVVLRKRGCSLHTMTRLLDSVRHLLATECPATVVYRTYVSMPSILACLAGEPQSRVHLMVYPDIDSTVRLEKHFVLELTFWR